MARPWAEAELALLRDTSLTLAEVAERTGRTQAAGEHKAAKLGVDRSFRTGCGLIPGGGEAWTEAELAVLRDTSLPLDEVARRTGRTRVAAQIRARTAGIQRYAEWAEWELALVADVTLTLQQVAAQTGRGLGAVAGQARAVGVQRGIRHGSDHYNWVGGYSVEQSWRGTDWPTVRVDALERDGYTCQDCGFVRFSGLGLRVHHVIPYRLRGVNDLEWLITLCKRCHIKRPEHRWQEIPEDLAVLLVPTDQRGDDAPLRGTASR